MTLNSLNACNIAKKFKIFQYDILCEKILEVQLQSNMWCRLHKKYNFSTKNEKRTFNKSWNLALAVLFIMSEPMFVRS